MYTKNYLKNIHTGTVGDINTISFNGNKIITSGGGGMLLTNNIKYYQKAKYLINQSKNDSIKFIHNEVGYNYRISNIHSAIGFAQLENINKILNRKKIINKFYLKYINKIKGLTILKGPDYAKNNYWLNILKIDLDVYKYNAFDLIEKLNKENIFVRNVWYPNHLQKPFLKYQRYLIENANNKCSSYLCLPSSLNIKEKDIKKIYKVLNV